MNDENDFTFSTTTSTTRRRSCIQKTNETEKRGYEDDEKTESRKSRRVSFSSRIQVKTIDDSVNDPNCSKEKITLENTQANKQLLADISNTVASTNYDSPSATKSTKPAEPIKSDGNVSLSQSINETIVPMRHYLDISNLNQTNLDVTAQQNVSMDLVNNSNSFINLSSNMTVLDQTGMNITNNNNSTMTDISSMETSKVVTSANVTMDVSRMPFNDLTVCQPRLGEDKNDETLVTEDENSNDKTSEVSLAVESRDRTADGLIEAQNTSNILAAAEMSIKNQTFDVTIAVNLTTNEPGETCPESTRKMNDKSVMNVVDATYVAECINEVTMPTQNETSRYEHSFAAQNLSANTSKLLQSMQHTSINDLEASAAALDLTCGGYSNTETSQFLQNNFEELKGILCEKLEEMKRFKKELDKGHREKKQRKQTIVQDNELNREMIKNLNGKYLGIKEKLSQLKVECGLSLFDSKNQQTDQKELDSMIAKNEANKLSLKNATQNLNDIKDKVRANSERIKALQSTQVEQEKFKNLSEQIFDKQVIEYTLVNFENDTILLSFFFDFIQLEIKATNIVNDLNSFQRYSSDLETLNTLLNKCTNYPIQKLTTRALIDSVGNSIDSPFYVSEQDRNNLRRKNSSRVPVYIKYCVNLILEDVGDGDLMSLNKRYRYVKDIPMLIAHFNLAAKCATNLAKDFEYFANKCYDSEIKCDFDFKNHMVSITLPSLEDSCYYKLKLSILPGKYYQEAIPFSIEPVNKDDVFTPNIKKLSKVIEGQYFEDGSLRHFLSKLHLLKYK